MNVPQLVIDRVQQLSAELTVQLSIERHWDNEFGTGHYCRVHGVVCDSPQFRVEIAGSLAVGTRADDTDMFVLVNGVRVAPANDPNAYLHRKAGAEFGWDDLDEAYYQRTDLDSLLLRKS